MARNARADARRVVVERAVAEPEVREARDDRVVGEEGRVAQLRRPAADRHVEELDREHRRRDRARAAVRAPHAVHRREVRVVEPEVEPVRRLEREDAHEGHVARHQVRLPRERTFCPPLEDRVRHDVRGDDAGELEPELGQREDLRIRQAQGRVRVRRRRAPPRASHCLAVRANRGDLPQRSRDMLGRGLLLVL